MVSFFQNSITEAKKNMIKVISMENGLFLHIEMFMVLSYWKRLSNESSMLQRSPILAACSSYQPPSVAKGAGSKSVGSLLCISELERGSSFSRENAQRIQLSEVTSVAIMDRQDVFSLQNE